MVVASFQVPTTKNDTKGGLSNNCSWLKIFLPIQISSIRLKTTYMSIILLVLKVDGDNTTVLEILNMLQTQSKL